MSVRGARASARAFGPGRVRLKVPTHHIPFFLFFLGFAWPNCPLGRALNPASPTHALESPGEGDIEEKVDRYV